MRNPQLGDEVSTGSGSDGATIPMISIVVRNETRSLPSLCENLSSERQGREM